jgi:hypothetical protein
MFLLKLPFVGLIGDCWLLHQRHVRSRCWSSFIIKSCDKASLAHKLSRLFRWQFNIETDGLHFEGSNKASAMMLVGSAGHSPVIRRPSDMVLLRIELDLPIRGNITIYFVRPTLFHWWSI